MSNPLQEPTKALLTVLDVCERLRCGRTFTFALIASGKLKAVRIGRLRRIRPDDLDEYVRRLGEVPL